MKALNLRRHSIKDGAKNTIGPRGLLLAQREGELDGATDVSVICHGPLVRTAQTAGAYAVALGRRTRWLPVVEGLGDEDLFKEMVTPKFDIGVQEGLSNIRALVYAHGVDKCRNWAATCLVAVERIFAQLKDGEVCTGFFHSPTIELAAWACVNFRLLDYTSDEFHPMLLTLGEMEGYSFIEYDDGSIGLVVPKTMHDGIITVAPLSAVELTLAGLL